ncbi:MAG: CHAT domain-containing protein [Saprospiraceae bacterium]|nr:CHAT domain-containing protein [Saprospiraceae bacterium]
MNRSIGVFIFSLLCIHMYGTEIDLLHNLYNKINNYENAGAHNLVLENSLKLFELASTSPNDSIKVEYRCKSLFFQLDYYRDRNGVEFDRIFQMLKNEIRPDVPLSFAIQYGIYINEYEFYKEKNTNFDKINVLNQAETLLLKHQTELENSDIAFYRMMIQFRKGDAYLKDGKLSLAGSQYNQAMTTAIEADSLKSKKEKKFWGFEQARLVDLFKFAVVSGDLQSIDKVLNKLHSNKRKSLYDKRWERELIQVLLRKNGIKSDQMNSILTQLTSNDLLTHDPIIFIKISQHFIQHDFVSKSIYYRDKALALLPAFKNDAQVNLEFLLLQGSLALKNCNFPEIDSMVVQSKKWLFYGPDLHMKGSRSDYLVFMQKATSMYTDAYRLTKDTALLTKCARLTDEAIKVLYYLRLDLPDDADRVTLLTQLKSLCDHALYNYYELFKHIQPTQAQLSVLLNYFESNKSFNLFLAKDLPPDERLILNSLKSKVAEVNQLIQSSVEQIDSLIILKSILVDSSISVWQHSHLNFEMLDMDVVQAGLPADQTIVEYFNFNQAYTYALVINKQSVIFKQLPLSLSGEARNIDELLLSIGTLLTEFSDNFLQASKDYIDVATKIYNLLILPFEQDLKHKILIVPEANMANLPWAALLTQPLSTLDCRKWPYWVKTNTIASQHSLSIWAMDHQRVRSPVTFNRPFVAFGPTFVDLHHNVDECQELQKMIGGDVYLGDQATMDNFLKFAPYSKIIHISSHAQASPDDQDSSIILFDGGMMTSGEIAEKSLPADLVFLSACETGIGKKIEEEGVFSLARSFFNAGASSVISTLWKVSDQVANLQVRQIYQHLLNGRFKDEAIQEMQLDYISHARTAESAFPFYWAAFQCQGDLAPLIKDSLLSRITNLFSLIPMFSFSLAGLGGYLFYSRKYLSGIIQLIA